MASRMPSFGFFLGSSLVVVVYCLSLGGEALAESASNLVGNGNFEELKGYFPAGVMVRRGRSGKGHFLPHWKVSERGAPVEIISSLFWQSSLGSHDSRYAVHLNTRVGPGGIQTEFPSPWNTSFFGMARYQLSVDVAGNPNGGSAVKLMEVLVSPSDCRSQKLSVTVARDANSKRLNWETHVLALNVHGSEPTVMLQFRSLTPGAYGPLIDNVRLVPLQGDLFDSELCDGNSDEEMKERPVKTLTKELVERMWMSAETWFRQRFLRREDW